MGRRCFSCMHPISSDICDNCGFDNKDVTKRNNELVPGSILNDRYEAGIMLDRNGEGITYIGFDMQNNCVVEIREFFPDTLSQRNLSSQEIDVKPGYEIQYKALMTDFVELSKQLINIKGQTAIQKVLDIFAFNKTIYTIYERVEGLRLSEYLIENTGELTWKETEELFLPLLYSVKLLHTHGIIHRGISPETIYVTNDHELKLKGTCISAVRAINSEVSPEFFTGYTAPEQYQRCQSHGEWTDVYSICAVLYKTLTGTMPPRTDLGRQSDTVMPPDEINQLIPRNVSLAITRGLSYDRENRIQNITELIGILYAVSDAEDEEIEAPVKVRKVKLKLPVWLTVTLCTLPVMLILFFLAYFLVLGRGNGGNNNVSSLPSSDISSEVSSDETSSDETSSTSKESVVVEDFTGKMYDDIVNADIYKNMFTFKAKKEAFDDTVSIGEIISQSIEKDTVVEKGAEIQFTVSKGKRYIQLAPIIDQNGEGISPEDYAKYLEQNGIKARIEEISSAMVESGEIDHLSHSITVVVDRESVTEITIYVAK